MKTYYLFDYHKIRERRERLGLTQRGCADSCRVKIQQWQKWENGTNLPNANSLVEIAKALQMTVQDLHLFYAKVEIDDLDERQIEL